MSKERQQNKDQNKAKALFGGKDRQPVKTEFNSSFRMGAENERATLPIFSMRRRSIIICSHTRLEY